MEKKRTKKIQIRLTPEELAAIEEKKNRSSFNSVAALIRYCVLDGKSLPGKTKSSDQKMILELARQIRPIGVNLNQIARAVNSINRQGKGLNLEKLEKTLRRIEQKLEQIEQTVKNNDR
jgi:uncharacterized protein YukE